MAFQFPDPNITTEFLGDNGITYSWDAADEKWVVKQFGKGDCWTEMLTFSDTEAGGGDFYKDGNAYIFNNAKTWSFSKYITKVGDIVYFGRVGYTVTSYTSIPIDASVTGMALEFNEEPDVSPGRYANRVSSCPVEKIYEGNPDLPMQFREYFELDPTGTYAIAPDGIVEEYYVSGGDDLEYLRAGVWWIDPTKDLTKDPEYTPNTVTHLLISGGRFIDNWYEDPEEYEYIYNDAKLAPTFKVGDFIQIRARGIDVYQPLDDPSDNEAWGERFNDVWQVTEVYEVKDDNNVASGWRLNNVHAYKIEKCVEAHNYNATGITLWSNNDQERSYIFCAVDFWFDVNEIQREVFGGEEYYEPDVIGRSEAVSFVWDTSNLVDAPPQTTRFHPTENYVAFNKDNIPSSTVSWQTVLEPYPQRILLEFEDGQKYDMVIEFIGSTGQYSRTRNFKILDRGNFPVGDLSAIDGLEFDVYKRYKPGKESLQTQIDNLLDLTQYPELP